MRTPGSEMRIHVCTTKGMVMRVSSRQIVAESQRIAVQFIIAELNVALTFLDVAETTGIEETRSRNEQHARSAYDTVLRLLPRVSPLEEELPTLHAKLAELRDRIHALGFVVDEEPESSAVQCEKRI